MIDLLMSFAVLVGLVLVFSAFAPVHDRGGWMLGQVLAGLRP